MIINIRKTKYGDIILEHFKFEMDMLLREASLESSISKNFGAKICVAVSGGSDSVSLLLMANQFARKTNREIVCVTVDHQLRPESSSEAAFVADLCRKLSVEHHTLVWRDSYKIKSAGKLENAARNARYSLIKAFCEKHQINILLLGHTLDDQLETFLLREQSGSSNLGLAGMSKIRRLFDTRDSKQNDIFIQQNDIFILRPIMIFRRKNLRSFLSENEIAWKDDPMNDDPRFRRVFYREKIKDYSEVDISELSDKIKEFGISRRLIETEAVAFLKNHCKFSKYGYVDIAFSELLNQESNVQCEVLRRILWDIGGKSYPPNISASILDKIISGSVKTLSGCLIKTSLSRNTITIVRERRNLEDKKVIVNSGNCVLNNFLIKVTNSKPVINNNNVEYVVSCGCNSVVYNGLSKDVRALLPYVSVNGKVVFAYGADSCENPHVCGVACQFLHRYDLFDIFLH